MVAWQFIARDAFKKTTRPVGHGLSWSTRAFTAYGGRSSPKPNHTVPFGTVPFSRPFQAVNCLATFIPSLWDKNSSSAPDRNIEATQPAAFEDEGDDEYEDDWGARR